MAAIKVCFAHRHLSSGCQAGTADAQPRTNACFPDDTDAADGRAGVSQLGQFVGGENGTGKSGIEALVQLFAKNISNRLFITATSGTAAARIHGITTYSACGLAKDFGEARILIGDYQVFTLRLWMADSATTTWSLLYAVESPQARQNR